MTLRYEQRAFFHLPSSDEVFFLGRKLWFGAYQGCVGFERLAGQMVRQCTCTLVLNGMERIALEGGRGGRIKFSTDGFQDEAFRRLDMKTTLDVVFSSNPHRPPKSSAAKMRARRFEESHWSFSPTETPALWNRIHRALIERKKVPGVHPTSKALQVIKERRPPYSVYG